MGVVLTQNAQHASPVKLPKCFLYTPSFKLHAGLNYPESVFRHPRLT